MDLYIGTLPRQVRWQAELTTQEALEAPALVSVVHELERSVDVLVRVGALADRTPQWVAGERQSLQDFLSSERRAVLDGVRGERVAVLDSLHVERVETLVQPEPLAGAGWSTLSTEPRAW
ncbi:hypothetical protein [Cystobacter fuscus]|uniref:hypothetical protein n=1 Tax=Cystobacter fuscus TaxID=43 RepID=UPI0037BE4736